MRIQKPKVLTGIALGIGWDNSRSRFELIAILFCWEITFIFYK